MIKKSAVAKILLVGIFVVFTLFPIYWLVLTSFKPKIEIISSPSLLVANPTLENYSRAFVKEGLSKALINNLLIVIGSIIYCIPPSILAGYVFSRYKFTGDNHLFFWLLANRMSPAAAFILPYFIVYTSLKLYDTILGLVLVYSIFNLPIATWLIKGFIDLIPREIEEAARIDGYGLWRIIGRIVIPLVSPGIAVASLFVFIFSWNELLFASILSMVNSTPVNPVIMRMSTMAGIEWGVISAISVVSMVPGLIFIHLLRNHIARALTFGYVR